MKLKKERVKKEKTFRSDVDKQSRPRVKSRDVCYFCEKKSLPSYKAYEELGRFLSGRAKLINRKRSGLCAKHQRKLAIAVKRARYLGLFPFKAKI